jgi:choline dehydrogenase-like flavoprotein
MQDRDYDYVGVGGGSAGCIESLRIADASVIPTTPVSALNGPSMLIGYRAAQFIRAEQ